MSVALRRVSSLPFLFGVFLVILASGALAQAAVSQPGERAFVAAVAPAKALIVRLREQAVPLKTVTVWEGKDLDGDGAADFVNPTGREVRDHDGFGDGEFGASRDGGVRRHEGVDYIARAGQAAKAPISGFVTKIGQAYAGAPELKFVEITNPALNVTARVFYVAPEVTEGQTIRLGETVGRVESLQHRYAGITDHVHLEVAEAGRRVNAETLIVAQVKATTARG